MICDNRLWHSVLMTNKATWISTTKGYSLSIEVFQFLSLSSHPTGPVSIVGLSNRYPEKWMTHIV